MIARLGPPVPFVAYTSALVALAFGVLAVESPKYAIGGMVALALVVVALRSLPAGVAVFTVLTFPQDLPGALQAGATVAKPLGALIAVAWAATIVRDRDSRLLPRDHPLLAYAAIAFVVWAVASLAWAQDQGATWYEVSRLFQVVLLFFVVYTAAASRKGFDLIAAAYLVGALLTAVYSMATGSYVQGRLSGIFDPNYFAAELIGAIFIAGFLMAGARRLRVRLVLLALLVFYLVAFVLTQSRGGMFGLAVGLLAAVFFAGRERARAIVAATLIVAAALAFYFEFASPTFRQRVTDISASGSSGRSDEWAIALRIIDKHPLVGVGLGNYRVVEPGYSTESINLQFVRQVVQQRLVAHNSYLEVFAELGVVGAALFVAILLASLLTAVGGVWRLERAGLRLSELRARGVVVGATGVLGAYVFLSAQYEKQLWLLMGLLVALPAVARAEQEEARERLPRHATDG
jgi:O-antigen ligase